MYRELADDVNGVDSVERCRNRQRVLRSCESAMERLATDRYYFARPARSLFNEIRVYFPMQTQYRVLTVVHRHVKLAVSYVDEHARAGVTFDGSPLCCHATTRKGTACQRVPLPGSKYCPSHQHLEDDFDRTPEVVAA
jgi:hypothetical protein